MNAELLTFIVTFKIFFCKILTARLKGKGNPRHMYRFNQWNAPALGSCMDTLTYDTITDVSGVWHVLRFNDLN